MPTANSMVDEKARARKVVAIFLMNNLFRSVRTIEPIVDAPALGNEFVDEFLLQMMRGGCDALSRNFPPNVLTAKLFP